MGKPMEPSSDTAVSKHYIHLNKWVARYSLQHPGNVLPFFGKKYMRELVDSLQTSTYLTG